MRTCLLVVTSRHALIVLSTCVLAPAAFSQATQEPSQLVCPADLPTASTDGPARDLAQPGSSRKLSTAAARAQEQLIASVILEETAPAASSSTAAAAEMVSPAIAAPAPVAAAPLEPALATVPAPAPLPAPATIAPTAAVATPTRASSAANRALPRSIRMLEGTTPGSRDLSLSHVDGLGDGPVDSSSYTATNVIRNTASPTPDASRHATVRERIPRSLRMLKDSVTSPSTAH